MKAISLALAFFLMATPGMATDTLALARELAPSEPELAITEYLRYLYEHPEAAQAELELGSLYLRTGHLEQAYARLKDARTIGDSNERERAALLLADLADRRGDPELAVLEVEDLIPLVTEGSLRTTSLWHLMRFHLEARQYMEAAETADRLEQPSLAAALRAYGHRSFPSIEKAGWLSTFLPGAGQAYMADWPKAAGSLLLNAGLAAAGLYAIRSRDWVAGIFLLNYGPRYYLGGIKGAQAIARDRIEAAHAELMRRLVSSYPPLRASADDVLHSWQASGV